MIAAAAWSAGSRAIATTGILLFAAHLAWQVARLDIDDPGVCLAVFKSSRYAGLLLFAALALEALLNSSR